MSNNVIAKEMFQSALNESVEKSVPTSFLSGYFVYLILGIVCIGMAVYLYLYYTKSPLLHSKNDIHLSTEPQSNLLELLEKKPAIPNVVEERKPAIVEETKPSIPTVTKDKDEAPTHISNNSSSPQAIWCFVGEDISGRYCVKVPSKESCVPDRTFRSLSECALIDGNHLPAGIEKDGVKFSPLYSMNIEEK